MNRKVTIDASVFTASFSEEEIFCEASRALLRKVGEEKMLIVVPTLTLFEILQAYYRNTNDLDEVNRIQEQLIELNLSRVLKILNLEASFFAHFVAHHHEFSLKTSDTIVALTALKENCPLISWDKQLVREASKKVATYTPLQYLKAFS